MKRIGIDARLINQTGVGVYIQNLLSNLAKLSTDGIEFYVYVLSSNQSLVTSDKFQVRTANFRWHSVNEQVGFYRQLMHDDLDLMHFTYFSYPILYKRPFVITIHDLTPLLFKTGRASTHGQIAYNMKHIAYRYLMNQAATKSQAIITPTKSVKDEILQNYPSTDPNKITVTYEGVSEELTKTKENATLAKQFPEPFFIYVGNFYPHKNVERLVEAYAQVTTDTPLILVGPQDYFGSRVRETVNRLAPRSSTRPSKSGGRSGKSEVGLNVQHKVQIYHPTDISDLVYLYKHARALIHPSLSEGFGLPIVEAANFGLPIIASDIPVFRELLGDSYTAFNPRDKGDITSKITAFINSPTLTKPVVQKNLSFAHMTKQTFALYQSQI